MRLRPPARPRLRRPPRLRRLHPSRGEPSEIAVVKSAGPILDRAVLEAVRTWRFEPARKGGVKVVRWVLRHTFEKGP